MPAGGPDHRTVLVAGGAGFVGSHLAESLLADGYVVIAVDNLQTGSRANIAHLESSPRFTFLQTDVREPLQIDGPIGRIYNLACPASPVHYQADPIGTLMTSVVGSKNLLDLALARGAEYLQASTSEVYGDPAEHPQTEAYWGHVNPIGIRACYDEGKRAAETLCFDYARKLGARVRVARIFNTYGPRMARDDGRVVSNFIVQALAGADITVYGEGRQTRSFQYVDDLIAGLRRVMAQQEIGPFNLGNPEEYTILQLAGKIVELTGGRSRIVREPLPQDDPTRRNPDITKARALGWEPKVALEEGLQKTIAYFRSLA